MLTKKQLQAIEEVIRKRFLAFTHEALGEAVLTPAEVRALRTAGLLRKQTRNMVGDSYTLGKIVALINRGEAKKMSFEDVLKRAKKMSPTTALEKQAAKWATDHAAQYIQGVRDDMLKDVRATTARAAMGAIQAIQNKVSQAVIERKTPSQLKTDLFHLIDDKHRDWHRVASTEMGNAIQNGIAEEIRSNHGTDQLVYKLLTPQACVHCKRLYMDGGRPIIFKLSDLVATNYGKKARDWEATVGPTHPYCECQLVMLPDGYELDASGKLSFVGKSMTPDVVKKINADKMISDRENCTCCY